ncbi:unnamed protein product [Ranitomeya imitator]|uniref:Uncharacterized protein n=1 Tax=Ranitomeya imitator TaxID=111125 RepID=A0ABN9MH79_9NEOB|nr:unnamed protein product [Ranitomeya imitator]
MSEGTNPRSVYRLLFACEDEEAEAEVLGTGLLEAGAGGDGDTSADLGDDDDIPSDAEAEERLQQSERLRLRLDEGSDAPSRGQNESDRGSCAASATPEPEVFSPKAESEKVSVLTPKEQTSPSIRFFPDPYVPRAGSKASTPLEPKAFTPVSPVCSQPTPTQELPSPVITSTPLAKLPFSSHVVRTDSLTSPNSEEALKRIDLIEEFWTKSAEIRRSLGLTPVERSRTSESSSSTATRREEPATLQKCLASWQNGPESIPSPLPQAKVKSPDVPQPPKLEEVRKSFVESVDEIPFADDVEDTYDERTDNSSLHERFFTPPTSRTKLQRLPLTKENGELPSSVERGRHRKRLLPQLTTEAKELAEERMRAREKSVKSAALRDVMAQQLHKMKQLENRAGASPRVSSVFHQTLSSPPCRVQSSSRGADSQTRNCR